MSGRHARCTLGLALALLVSAGRAEAQAPPPSPTVETLAGPGFCEATTVIDATPGRVGALAVDDDGRVFTDLPDAPVPGAVRAVDGTDVTLLRTGEPAGPIVAEPGSDGPRAPGASRLAPGPPGGAGVVVAAGSRVIQVDARPPSLRTVAGAPAGQPPPPEKSSSGDGGPAELARFTSARSVAADAAHNLYVADQLDPETGVFVIRFINRSDDPAVFYAGTADELTVASGTIQTVVGAPGSTPEPGGEGQARHVTLAGVPPSLAVAGDRLYVASSGPGSAGPSGSVRVVNLSGSPTVAHGVTVGPGMMKTVAGGAPGLRDADGIPAASAALSYPSGIAADEDGGLYVAEPERNRVRLIDADGVISTFAGTGDARPSLGLGGLDRPASKAQLDRPVDVKVGSGGRVFVSDAGSDRVLVVDPAGDIHLAAGSSRPSRCAGSPSVANDVNAPRPAEGQPFSVVAAEGDVFFVNLLSRRVMRRDGSGVTTEVLGPTDRCPGIDPCPEVAPAELRWPAALAVGGGGLYVYDVIGAKVLFLNLGPRPTTVQGVTVEPEELKVVAGNGSRGAAGDGGPALAAQFGGNGSVHPETFPNPPSLLLTENAVGDIAVDRDGNLFVADAFNGRVRQVDRDGVITTIAGREGPAPAEGCCSKPSGLAVDAFGNLYVSDLGTRQIWLLNRSSVPVNAHGRTVPAGAAQPVAGTGRRGLGGDGAALDTPLYQPYGLVADGRGNLLFADYHDNTVRRLDAAGYLYTVAGTGAGGFNGDGLPARQTTLFNPTDVTLDQCGNLLVADFRNDRIRRVNLAGPCDASLAAPPSGSSGDSRPWWLVAVGVVLVAVVGVTAITGRRRRARALRL